MSAFLWWISETSGLPNWPQCPLLECPAKENNGHFHPDDGDADGKEEMDWLHS